MQVDNTGQKVDTLSTALSVNVEERCQCGFSPKNILDPGFHCFTESEDAVTYRAEIIGTGETSPADIATHIQNWITQGALITFDFVRIKVDSSCQVIVLSILDPECNNPTTAPPPSSSAPLTSDSTTEPTSSAPTNDNGQASVAVLGGVLGSALLVIIVVLVVAVTVLVYCWLFRKRSGKLEEIMKERYVI